MPSKYDEQIREKAVRLVRDHAEDYPTEWAAIKAVSGRLGMNAETLRKWLRQAEVDVGQRIAAMCVAGSMRTTSFGSFTHRSARWRTWTRPS